VGFSPDSRAKIASWFLPAIYERVFFDRTPSRDRRRTERVYDPPPRVRGVDHVVDGEVGRDVERLAALIQPRHQVLEPPFALRGIGDGRQLVAVAELRRPLERHRPELAGRP